jgi:hypothetical protein
MIFVEELVSEDKKYEIVKKVKAVSLQRLKRMNINEENEKKINLGIRRFSNRKDRH